MLTPDGLTRYSVIQANGQSFPEHKVESKMEGNKLIMTCYVEIQPGVPYGVCVQTQTHENDRILQIEADNTFIDARFFRKASDAVPMEKHHIHIFSKQIDAQSFRRLQFAPLELTDEDDNCNTDTQYLMKLGEIECTMSSGKVGAVTEFKAKPSIEPHETKKIHEKSKKLTTVGAKTAFGSVETLPPPINAPAPNPNPDLNPNTRRTFAIDTSMPSQKIIFKYRTKQALDLLGIFDQPILGSGLPIQPKQEEEEDVKPFASLNNNVKREGLRSQTKAKAKAKALVDDDEEDELEEVKPFEKKVRGSSGVGSTYESAIDLTDD